MAKRFIVKEDVAPFIDATLNSNGEVDIEAAYRSMKNPKNPTKYNIGFAKFKEVSLSYMNDRGFKIRQEVNVVPKPLMPRSPSNQSVKSAPDTTRTPPPAQTIDFEPTLPIYTFSDVGGLESQKQQLVELISLPLLCANLFKSVGSSPVRGILLHGPSGCGKTMLVEAAAGEFAEQGLTFFKISATELLSSNKSFASQSESRIRAVFNAAANSSPSILFIDEIDTISGKRENSSARIVSQLTQCMDQAYHDQEHNVIVIGATNKIEMVDSTLRRPGRFSREVSLGIPDFDQRFYVLDVCLNKVNAIESIDRAEVARAAEGFIGADIAALVQEAAMLAVIRASNEQQEAAIITQQDLFDAIKLVQPTLRREGFATLPPASFDDIGGLGDVKAELKMTVIDAVIRPDIFKMYGHRPSSGVILYGPPGCGKTLLARAIAHEADRAAFISVKGPELLNKYLGESESAIRSVFRRARDSAPCIIFFDEIDAICPRRSEDSSNAAASRVVNQLLTEMDGVDDRGRVFVIGATNRLELIDEAMLRPGRLDKKIQVPLPDQEGRKDILNKHLNKVHHREEIDVEYLSGSTDGYSGAELEELTSEAIEAAIKESSGENWIPVNQKHFNSALEKLNRARSLQKAEYDTGASLLERYKKIRK